MSTNNKKPPFDNLLVRQALAYAIDRDAVNTAAANGLGKPIGSHYTPTDPYFNKDLVKTYPYNPEKARALLKQAGVTTPIDVSLKLPPVPYARLGGEVVAAELAKVGINAKIENVEWAQWLDSVLKTYNFDLTIISHVEPRDLNIYANPNYYFQYDSAKFQEIYKNLSTSTNSADIKKYTEEAQKQLTDDAVNVYLFALPQVCVTKKNVKGFWKNSPIFANDLSSVRIE